MRRTAPSPARALAAACLLSALALAAPPARSQTGAAAQEPPRTMLSITEVRVRPDMVADYESMVKNETLPAFAKGGGKWREMWQTAGFGDLYAYTIVTPIDSWAQYDGPGAVEKALGKEGVAAWRAKVGRMVEGVRTFAIEYRPELSYRPELKGQPKYAVVTKTTVAPGRTAEFEDFIAKEMLPVVKQSDVPGYWVHKVLVGGDPNEYVTVVLHDTFADLQKGPPVRRVLGKDGAAKVWQKLAGGVILHSENSFMRMVPELSWAPAATAAK